MPERQPNGLRWLELNDGVAGFQQSADGSLEVLTSSGRKHPACIVILAIGVRPETALAEMAGIEIGQRGGIRVDEHMRTSNPDIFAVGDAVEVKDFVTGQWALIPLAVAGGVGNAVFHPADFAVLNARVSHGRLGRAYGAHGLAGTLGWVLAPAIGVFLAELADWRTALGVMGAAGLAAAATLALMRGPSVHRTPSAPISCFPKLSSSSCGPRWCAWPRTATSRPTTRVA